MKKLFIILVVAFLISRTFAQSPEKISYQAVIRNSNNNLVTNSIIGMQISILQSSVNGTAVYTEIQMPTTNSNGLVTIEIGQDNDFSDIDWANGPYFIKTEIDLERGTNYTITSSSQLLSVPYALYAKTADSFSGTIDTSVTNEIQNLSSVLSQGADAGNQNITNLTDPVNKQDAATKAYVDAVIENLNQKGVIGIDYDGNIYSTVRIGSQIWMAENLKTTKYNDGTNISNITENNVWQYDTIGGYCWYNNNIEYKSIYGALYNWYAVNTNKLCPIGWHVPTDTEWEILIDYIGGFENAATKLKEPDTIHWNSYAEPPTNETGFTALPSGVRYDDRFDAINLTTGFRVANEYNTNTAHVYEMNCWENDVTVYNSHKGLGTSIRCIKDQ